MAKEIKMESAWEKFMKDAVPVDMTKVMEDHKKHLEKSQAEWDRAEAEEKARIEKMHCPACKSGEKKRVLKYESNGIIGPGYHSHVTEDYYVCLNCGAHYSDVKKKDLGKRPSDLFY